MANQDQLALIKRSVAAWNQWREEHPDIYPDLIGADLSGADLSGADLSNTFLIKANLRQANLIGVRFQNDNTPFGVLTGADFIDANLTSAKLAGADLTHVNLLGADLSGADLNNARLPPKSIVAEATLTGTSLREVDLSGVDLSRKDLSRADLTGANLKQANLTDTILQGATLTNANLSGALLVRTNLENAALDGCSVYGVSVWDVRLEGASQISLNISGENEPIITVDDLEVAQFIYLLLNHKKLRNVLNAVTKRGVLLLGRFGGGGLEVLQAIAAKLREEQYLPIIFDFERPEDRNYTETVKTLAGLARFVIADLSGPSVPQELYGTVPHFKIPFIPIVEVSRRPYSMVADILEYPWVVRPPVTFATTDELLSLISSKIIAPAEERLQARQQLLNELFAR
jgi:uncharacterized protein YjbI with pentapeptide repeats